MKRKHLFFLLLAINTLNFYAQNPNKVEEKFKTLPFGSIKPSGWIKKQMQKDIDGFVGNLDKIVPSLINDPIYSAGRLHKNSKAKDLGNQKEGDAAGDEQYKWWNSETQSNWWDGYIRNVLLLNDKAGLKKVQKHIREVLNSQDKDGYIGIYDQDLRYHFNSWRTLVKSNTISWFISVLRILKRYKSLVCAFESCR